MERAAACVAPPILVTLPCAESNLKCSFGVLFKHSSNNVSSVAQANKGKLSRTWFLSPRYPPMVILLSRPFLRKFVFGKIGLWGGISLTRKTLWQNISNVAFQCCFKIATTKQGTTQYAGGDICTAFCWVGSGLPTYPLAPLYSRILVVSYVLIILLKLLFGMKNNLRVLFLLNSRTLLQTMTTYRDISFPVFPKLLRHTILGRRNQKHGRRKQTAIVLGLEAAYLSRRPKVSAERPR